MHCTIPVDRNKRSYGKFSQDSVEPVKNGQIVYFTCKLVLPCSVRMAILENKPNVISTTLSYSYIILN